MRNVVRRAGLLLVGTSIVVTATAGRAWAHGDDEGKTRTSSDELVGPAPAKTGDEAPPRFLLGADLLLGFGKTTVVTEELPTSLTTLPANVVESSRVSTQTFVFSGAYDVTKNFAIGLRLPLTFGAIDPPTRDARSATALGAIELEAEGSRDVFEGFDGLKAIAALAVALPTAQGAPLPNAAEIASGTTVDQQAYDRFALNHAASASRGFSEVELFAPRTLGLVPKVALRFKGDKLTLETYAKFDALISTVTDAPHSFVGELVLGAHATYRVREHVEVGGRIWTTIPLSGNDPGQTAVGVVEPEVRFPVGRVVPYVGAVLPFVGPLTDPYFVGIRLGVTGRF